jgi:peptide/nickel transport system permease protein
MRAVVQRYLGSRSGVAGLAALTTVVAVAAAAPVLVDRQQLDVLASTGPLLAAPSGRYPLGTDENGVSVLALTVWGARSSQFLGVLATALSLVAGTTVGVAAGHLRGWPARALTTLTDWFLVLPSLPLAIALAGVLRPGWLTTILAIALTNWATIAQLIRARVLAIEELPYVERSRALGAGHRYQLAAHVLPGVLPLVVANGTLAVANAIMAEATLAFLGLGVTGEVSWGGMLRTAVNAGAVTAGAWSYLLAPGLAITAVVLAFALCGRAVEAALDPLTRAG